MAERDIDQPYLALGRPGYAGRTFLGGLKLSTRTGVFVTVGVLAAFAFAVLVVVLNGWLDRALNGLAQARTVGALATSVERAHADLRSREKQYVITRSQDVLDQSRQQLDLAARALDRLAAHPDADDLERAISTLRDGIVQYDQHLTALSQAAQGGWAAAGRALRDAGQALAPRVPTSGRRDAPEALARVNQLGSEMVLTGDPANLEALQEAYRALYQSIEKSSLPRGDRRVIVELLARHQSAMMALITGRVTLNEDAQRFDDIQLYIAPSLNQLRRIADEVTAEREAQVAEVRRFAAASVAGGGAALLLWILATGLIIMQSVTRPIEALAAAAGRLACGDRTVVLPGRGNRDAIGRLARAFDDWIAAVADAEHLRQDLEHAHIKTIQAVEDLAQKSHVHREAQDELEVMRRTLADYRRDMDEMEALLADIEEEAADAAKAPALPAPTPTTALARAQAEAQAQAGQAGRDPAFQQVSQHLSSISHQAAAAIIDVELTDTLVRNLAAARGRLEMLGRHVLDVRDHLNSFLFAQNPRRVQGDGGLPAAGTPEGRRALAAIRDAVDRSERALADCAAEVDRVTETAQRMAVSASDEARQATDQLVAQSFNLQRLLETLTHRTRPEDVARAADGTADPIRPAPVIRAPGEDAG
ncbi:MAG: hypothetical protein VW268_12070 [Rhodospirillaceae bacterium]